MADTIKKYLKLSSKDKLEYGNNARNTSKLYTFDKIQNIWLEHINAIMEAK